MRLILFLLFLTFTNREVPAQEKSPVRILAGAGWAHVGIRDKGISPLYYNGSHTLITSSLISGGDSMFNNVEINFLFGNITPAIYPKQTSSRMKSLKGGLNYSHMRFVTTFFSGKAMLHLGGILDLQFAWYKHNQMKNSSENSYSFNTLNASTLISYPLRINERNFNIEFRLFLPVAAAVLRPSYSYIKAGGFMDHSAGHTMRVINSFEVLTLNRFFGAGSEVSLKFIIGSSPVKIGYKWEYAGHYDINRLDSATHGITLQRVFNF